MFGGQASSCKCHLFDDTALLFLTVPRGMLCKKVPLPTWQASLAGRLPHQKVDYFRFQI